jgi:eukaryotic-like serine/threonine-protein kinase
MGVVYLAHDRERNADVALKTLSRMSPGAVYRLKNEFRALADLTHPNLVSLYELVAGPDHLFFAMELVDGIPFTRYVRGRATVPSEPPPEPITLPSRARPPAGVAMSGVAPRGARMCVADGKRLRPCLAQLCEAVAFLHDQGRLHRDLKPSNVLVTPQGRVVVLDFGLVRDHSADDDDRTPEMAVVGTPTYMAPEQALCLPLSPATDWYAVGTMLFEALTGRLPFEGPVEDVLMRKRLHDAPAPSSLVQGVPEGLDALCFDLLQHDPERRPTGAEVLRRVQEGGRPVRGGMGRPSSIPPPPDRPFIGRGRELARLEEALAEVGQGSPVLVRLSGRSGMGKSTLVRHFLRGVAQRMDAVVLRGRCHERESVPYKAFDHLVDGLSHHLRNLTEAEATALLPRDVQVLARVFPVLLRVDAVASAPRRDLEVHQDQELRRRAFAALKELFARIADRHTLVLHIEDMQWGDVDSVDLLTELLTPPEAPAMLVVVSHREEGLEVSDALRALDRLDARGRNRALTVRHVALTPLPAEASMDMIRTLLAPRGSTSEQRLEDIAAEAQGSPFLLEAFAEHLAEDDVPGPIRLQDVLAARIERLPASARRLLEVVATCGRPVPQAVAWRAAGVDGGGEAAVTHMRTERLVWTQGVRGQDLMDTYHERIREHVGASLSPGALRTYHFRLATAFRQEGDVDHEAIAHHFDVAGDQPQAVFHAVEAARRASEALAFDRAARLFQFALERVSKQDNRRLQLEEGLADALRNTGRGVEAGRAHVRAARLATGDRVLYHWRKAAEQLLRSGHVDEAMEVARPLLAAARIRMPETRGQAIAAVLWLNAKLRMRGLRYEPRAEAEVDPELLRRIDTCWAIGHGLVAVDSMEAGSLVTRAALLALRAGEPGRIACTLAVQAVMMAMGDMGNPEPVYKVARDAAERSGDRYAKAFVSGIGGFLALLTRGDIEANFQSMAEANRMFRTLDWVANFEISTSNFQMVASLFHMGDWKDMAGRIVEYAREAERRGDLYGAASLMLLYGDVPHLMRDDAAAGERQIEDYLSRWRERDSDLQLSFAILCQIRVAAYQRRAGDILDRVEARFRAAEKAGLLRGTWMRTLMCDGHARALLSAALELPEPLRAPLLRRAAKEVKRLWRTRHPIGQAFSEMHGAAVELACGRRDRGLALLESAEKRHVDLGLRLYAHCCRRARGLLVGGEAGQAAAREVDMLMQAQGIARPAAVARMLLPIDTGAEGAE